MMLCPMSAPTLFASELRAGRSDAIERFRSALTSGGSIRAAAALLGVNRRTVEDWACSSRRSAIPAVLSAVSEWRSASESASQKKNTITL
jgi:transposase